MLSVLPTNKNKYSKWQQCLSIPWTHATLLVSLQKSYIILKKLYPWLISSTKLFEGRILWRALLLFFTLPNTVSQKRYSIAVYWISKWVMNGWMNEWMTKLFLTLCFLSVGGGKTHPRASASSFFAHGKNSKMLVVWKKAYLTETKWSSGWARVFYQPRVQFRVAGSNGIQEACMFCWL